uniref:Uncharacterized protein n=1 Tax=Plectus sambesii TaxID=2011161 RepID=A0A914VC42_9BILA
PCDFSQAHLEGKAADFLASVQERQTAYLFIVITTVNLPPHI